jgi:hypothetical protein
LTPFRLWMAFAIALHVTLTGESFGSPPNAADCPTFLAGVRQGRIASKEIREASGIAASHLNPGRYYLNNDSGDRARIFAIDGRGNDLGTYHLKGANAFDWEDIAVGPARDLPGTFIYVADTGDNRLRRDWVVVYRVPEPLIPPGRAGGRFDLSEIVALRMQYPDGAAHNAEALLVDPQSADLYVVTKGRHQPASVFRYPAPQRADEIATLEKVASLQLGEAGVPGGRWVTGGDISIDGSQILLRTYAEVLLWRRGPGESIAAAAARPPCVARQRREPQGEAITWKFDQSGYITVSEGKREPIFFFARPPL